MPSTILNAMAMLVNTNAFWNVCRNASLSQSLMKFVMPMKWLGRPMNALDIEK